MSAFIPDFLDYCRKAFRWQHGRQGSGYDKMLLLTASWPIAFDSYLIRYPIGSSIPPHTDPVTGRNHYRLNIIVKRSIGGGEFICSDPILSTARIKLFRPDRSEHSVTEVIGSSRYVLSLGWLWGKSDC
ncbi:2OG-Fe(II) oxygenase [Thermomonas brevis]|uniref:2OG-Fe(II) oxygenase n=1 Tax=Thermomonas brevis TaxID=215691 RepID=UPI001CB6E27B|nr:2OG-Fe(II) oxygenase [Thermomonas brevis]